MSSTRPVWLTREQRDWFAAATINGPHTLGCGDHRDAIVAAWDAAPGDARDAIESALEYGESTGDIIADAHIALHALGMPRESA